MAEGFWMVDARAGCECNPIQEAMTIYQPSPILRIEVL